MLSVSGSRVRFPPEILFTVLIWNNKKVNTIQSQCLMSSHPSIFFRHAESKIQPLFRAISVEEVSVILCRNLWRLFQVSKTCHVFSSKLGNHFRKTIGNAINLDYFEKKESKEIRQLFGDQNHNKKYSIVLKQSISKPATQSTQFDAFWECYAKQALLQIMQSTVHYLNLFDMSEVACDLCTCNFKNPKCRQLQPQ